MVQRRALLALQEPLLGGTVPYVPIRPGCPVGAEECEGVSARLTEGRN